MKHLYFLAALLVTLTTFSCQPQTMKGEYQVYLSGDSIYVYDDNRQVVVLHSHDTGLLDSVLVADNQ